MSSEQEQSASKKLKKLVAKANFLNVVDRLRPFLKTTAGKFDPDLNQVGLSYLQGEGEYSKFITNDRSQFITYGYDDEERKRATLTFDPQRNCLLDSNDHPAEVANAIYNVTREGKLIVKLSEIGGIFNHSSITRDGAIN